MAAPLRQGYLTKEPLKPAFYSKARLRFVSLRNHVLYWADNETSKVKDSFPLDGATVEKTGDSLVIQS